MKRIFTVILALSALLFKERLSKRQWPGIGLILIFAGWVIALLGWLKNRD